MKVLIMSGSSSDGNTMRQCQSFSRSLPAGWECDIADLSRMDISHCLGCGACRNGACVHDDDMKDIIRRFDASDVIVFATPVRFNGPSSLVKTVIDRFQQVWNDPGSVTARPRRMTFMASSGSDNPDLRPCTTIFRSFCLSFGGEWVEPYVLKGTDSGTDGLEEGAAGFAAQISGVPEGPS